MTEQIVHVRTQLTAKRTECSVENTQPDLAAFIVLNLQVSNKLVSNILHENLSVSDFNLESLEDVELLSNYNRLVNKEEEERKAKEAKEKKDKEIAEKLKKEKVRLEMEELDRKKKEEERKIKEADNKKRKDLKEQKDKDHKRKRSTLNLSISKDSKDKEKDNLGKPLKMRKLSNNADSSDNHNSKDKGKEKDKSNSHIDDQIKENSEIKNSNQNVQELINLDDDDQDMNNKQSIEKHITDSFKEIVTQDSVKPTSNTKKLNSIKDKDSTEGKTDNSNKKSDFHNLASPRDFKPKDSESVEKMSEKEKKFASDLNILLSHCEK
mmetsp:Transcript_58756/g.127570  ORF Transcript_58756/g.127570 Transcript_58756/m.127570 type:complete len:323 (+) Transcript_58756:1936-2904(+)